MTKSVNSLLFTCSTFVSHCVPVFKLQLETEQMYSFKEFNVRQSQDNDIDPLPLSFPRSRNNRHVRMYSLFTSEILEQIDTNIFLYTSFSHTLLILSNLTIIKLAQKSRCST